MDGMVVLLANTLLLLLLLLLLQPASDGSGLGTLHFLLDCRRSVTLISYTAWASSTDQQRQRVDDFSVGWDL